MKIVQVIFFVFLFQVCASAQGYRLTRDIAPGSANGWLSGSRLLDSMGSRAFFVIRASDNSRSLWVSDGSTQGTLSLLKLDAGEDLSRTLTWAGRKVFTSLSGTQGRVLISDGSEKGTQALTSYYARLRHPVLIDSFLYFSALETPQSTRQSLFRLALLSRKVTRILEFGPEGLHDMCASGKQLVMCANPSGNATSFALLYSDGTVAGTKVVLDLGNDRLDIPPPYLTPVANRVFFAATRGFVSNWYVSDGTTAGTRSFFRFLDIDNEYRDLGRANALKSY